MANAMSWPQWTVIVLLIAGVAIALAEDGKPRSPTSFVTAFFNALITWWLLWMGGFFGN